ncbi:hypothetical protein [Elioraea thermophila]|uniref:hypothetical protein n=1 Tax=Elioraea thermophila TaxID=2185104 RepID=UPI000DF250D4|nr:hypothetical protein [Elioraea thermophila]
MSVEPERVVDEILAAAGGRLVSRIRLQKIAYLLDQLGARSGFRYVYHHYGPYSRDLDAAIFDAEAFGLVEETYEHRRLDGARYSVFARRADTEPTAFSYLSDERLRDVVKRLAGVNATVLELAATAHWLVASERVPDWKAEIIRRKGSKAREDRLAEALGILRELGLPPAAAQA